MTEQPAPQSFMPALRRNALGVFNPLHREFSRWLEDLGDGWDVFETRFSPRMDIVETDNSLEVTLEAAGMTKKDLRVAVADDVLTISGEKTAHGKPAKGATHLTERSFGQFSRSIYLPRSAQADRIEATMADGVLKVRVPKDGAAKAVDIPIGG